MRRFRARSLPADDRDCGWLEPLAPAKPHPSLEGSVSADAVVVGAGFTGLAAARRLAELEPSWRVVVLEAQRVGEGASGRSSGFVVDLAGFIAAMEPAVGDRFVRLSRHGIERLRSLVFAEGIGADWDDRGWFHVAASDAGLQGLDRLRQWLDGRGEPYRQLDDEGMADVTGSGYYRAGLRLPGSVLVHAGKLVRGLGATLPSSVTVFERSPVTAVTQGSRHRIETAGGSVSAPRLLFCLNAYGPNLGVLRRRVFPLMTFGSLSRPLRPEELEILGGEPEWGLLAQDPMGASVRRTRDQRILIRSLLAYRRDTRAGRPALEAARASHRRSLLARFPRLGAVDFVHTWCGSMGATPSLRPFFGTVAPGILATAGFTGAGIAMGTTAGMLLAERALDRGSPRLEDMESLPAPRWLPPDPFLGLGVRWRVGRMNRAGGPVP